ncbi:SDR family oxidoreductase [Streptomyces sp. NPDC003299]
MNTAVAQVGRPRSRSAISSRWPNPPQDPARPRRSSDEVAATALYLAGDHSCFTTGAELLVDGGVTQL